MMAVSDWRIVMLESVNVLKMSALMHADRLRLFVLTAQGRKLRKRYSGRSPGPAGCGHSKLARACTGLPLTSVQFISVTEVVTKKRNKIVFCESISS